MEVLTPPLNSNNVQIEEKCPVGPPFDNKRLNVTYAFTDPKSPHLESSKLVRESARETDRQRERARAREREKKKLRERECAREYMRESARERESGG